jgi:hypothetical protein
MSALGQKLLARRTGLFSFVPQAVVNLNVGLLLATATLTVFSRVLQQLRHAE